MRIDSRQVIALLALAGIVGLLVVLAKSFMAVTVPYEFMQFWDTSGSGFDWLHAARWWFAAGAAGAVLFGYQRMRALERLERNPLGALLGGLTGALDRKAVTILKLRLGFGVVGGALGEVFVRWIALFVVLILVQFFNALFFEAWLGFGLFHLMQTYILGPVANFVTLGYLHDQLTNPALWPVGFAMFAVCVNTAEKHEYQGFIGQAFAWAFGMFMFYMLFTFGLLACITVHVLWNVMHAFIAFGFATLRQRRRDAREAAEAAQRNMRDVTPRQEDGPTDDGNAN